MIRFCSSGTVSPEPISTPEAVAAGDLHRRSARSKTFLGSTTRTLLPFRSSDHGGQGEAVAGGMIALKVPGNSGSGHAQNERRKKEVCREPEVANSRSSRGPSSSEMGWATGKAPERIDAPCWGDFEIFPTTYEGTAGSATVADSSDRQGGTSPSVDQEVVAPAAQHLAGHRRARSAARRSRRACQPTTTISSFFSRDCEARRDRRIPESLGP